VETLARQFGQGANPGEIPGNMVVF
jgi:hypothetical protein